MSKTADCLFCGSNNLCLLSKEQEYVLLRCGNCNLIFKHLEQPNREGIQDRVYNDAGLRINDWMNIKKARERVKLLLRHMDKGRLLEIGCATGEFLETAAGCGFDTLGLDASLAYAVFAKEKGLNVIYGRLENSGLGQGEFDVVCMFHLIEHIEQPMEFLRLVNGCLKPGGLLFMITPNVEAHTDKLFGYRHPNFLQTDHLFFYSRDTLQRLLLTAGFDMQEVCSREHVHHVFTSLVQFLAGRLKSVVPKPEANGEGKALLERPVRGTAFLKKVIYRISYLAAYLFYPVLKPYGLIAERYGKGHELIVVAGKSLPGNGEDKDLP